MNYSELYRELARVREEYRKKTKSVKGNEEYLKSTWSPAELGRLAGILDLLGSAEYLAEKLADDEKED